MHKKPIPNSAIPLVVRVGITGWLSPKDQASVRPKVEEALSKIKNIVEKIARDHGDLYSTEPLPELRLISALSGSALLLTAKIAKDLGFKPQFPLPFDRDKCRNSMPADQRPAFDQIAATALFFELNGNLNAEAEAKSAANQVVLQQADLLIVMSRNDPTSLRSTVVSHALSLSMPILWISPKCDPCLWEQDPQADYLPHRIDIETLADRLKRILLLQEPGSSGSLQDYRQERQPTWTLGFVFKAFCRYWVKPWSNPKCRIKPFEESAEMEWAEIWEPLNQLDPAALTELKKKFFGEFARADGFADYYANLYRSSVVATYLMGALAILFAFLGSQQEAPEYWLLTELFLISAIIIITLTGKKHRWHDRWIDYRALAEELRQIQFLILFGRVTSSFRVPAHLNHGNPRQK